MTSTDVWAALYGLACGTFMVVIDIRRDRFKKALEDAQEHMLRCANYYEETGGYWPYAANATDKEIVETFQREGGWGAWWHREAKAYDDRRRKQLAARRSP